MRKRTPTFQQIEDALSVLAKSAREKRGDIEELLEDKYTDVRDALYDAKKRVKRRFKRAVKETSRSVRRTATAVNDQVHEKPWPVIGMIAGGSFVMGLLLGRRHNHTH